MDFDRVDFDRGWILIVSHSGIYVLKFQDLEADMSGDNGID